MASNFFADMNRERSRDPGEEAREVCIPNISPSERGKRARFAVLQFTITVILLGLLVLVHANPLWRLLLFFMFAAATTSYMQALDKT